MRFYRFWLIFLGIGLISLDKFSFVGFARDYVTIFIEKQVSLSIYRVRNYPLLLILNTQQQRELAKENADLQKKVEQYSVMLQQSQNQNIEIKNASMLKDDVVYNNFQQTIAKAILDVNFFANNQVLIDIGSNKNINLGDAVVNKDGVIGQINSVNKASAQLMFVTNPDFKIYLQSKTTKAKMLAQGGGHNSIIVNYIDKSDNLQVGDILETTGLDDTYPMGIPVAKVTKIFYENNGFNNAVCVPVVNYNAMQYVLVLHKE